jgi:hypothetical protein
MSPEQMTALTNTVLANFERQLRTADDLQFEHLAARAEGNYATDLGARERELVDYERARRTVTAGIGGAR